MQLQGTVSVLLAKAVNPNAVIPSGFCGFVPSNMQQKVTPSSQLEVNQVSRSTNMNISEVSTMLQGGQSSDHQAIQNQVGQSQDFESSLSQNNHTQNDQNNSISNQSQLNNQSGQSPYQNQSDLEATRSQYDQSQSTQGGSTQSALNGVNAVPGMYMYKRMHV